MVRRVLALLLLLMCAPAHASGEGDPPAQISSDTSFQVEQYESAAVSGFLGVSDARLLESWHWSSSLTTHYSDGALVVVDPDTGASSRIVGGRLATEAAFGLGLFGYGDIGVVVPVVPYQTGEDLGAFGAPGQHVSGFAMGDTRVIPRVKILNMDPGFGLALAVPVVIPTGDTSTFNSIGALSAGADLLADYRLSNGATFALNAGYHLRPERTVLTYVTDDQIRWGAGASWPLGGTGVSLLGGAFGSLPVATSSVAGASTDRSRPVEVLGGVRYQLGDRFATTLGGGAGIGRSVGTPKYRVLLTVQILPKPAPAQPIAVVTDVPVETPTPAPTPEIVAPTPPPMGTLTGVVRDTESGEPLAGVALLLPGGTSAQTDEYGRFRVEVSAEGPVPITVRHPRYAQRALTLQVTPGETRDVAVDLSPAAPDAGSGGTISGDVRSRDGQALQARLMIQSLMDVQVVNTDAEGKFNAPLPVGSYTVTVEASGYRKKIVKVDVRAGELNIYNFLLSPR